MFTVTYFEGTADDCSLNTTTLTCRSYQDAKDLINTFEPWEEVRLDYVGTPSEDMLPFWLLTYYRAVARFYFLCSISLCFIMSIKSLTTSTESAQNVSGAVGSELFNKNTMTTAGVCIGLGTGVASLALVSAALPVQMVTFTGLSAGLLYMGDRQDKGMGLIPFAGKDDTSTDTAKTTKTAKSAKSAVVAVAAAWSLSPLYRGVFSLCF